MSDSAAQPRYYEAIIKVNPADKPEHRARDIKEGLGYACALLHDEYGWSVQQILDVLEEVGSNIEWDYATEDENDE